MSTPRVFILSGPSGVGKSSIIRRLLELRPDVVLSVSTTTRAPRAGEKEGKDYYFTGKATFQRMAGEGGFIEWARNYDQYYGTGAREIQNIISSGRHALLDIDTQGALQIKKAHKGAVYVFISPPGLPDLEERLRGRGSETEDSLRKRLERAEEEIGHSGRYDHIIVNRDIEESVQSFIQIIEREKELHLKFEKSEMFSDQTFQNTADKATHYALEHIDKEFLAQSLEKDLKAALRGELEDLIRERLERILHKDLGRMVEEAYHDMTGK